MKNPQRTFEGSAFKRQRAFGGELAGRSHSKSKRAISTKLPMHVVVRGEKMRGLRSMRSSSERIRQVDRIVRSDARKFGVAVIEFANVGNHGAPSKGAYIYREGGRPRGQESKPSS